MPKIIAFLLGSLILFLLLDFGAIMGLSAVMNKLERKEVVKMINEDILFVRQELMEIDTTKIDCNEVFLSFTELKNYELKGDFSDSDIESSRVKVVQAVLQRIRCFQGQINDCKGQESCARASLWGLAECVRIAGSYLDYEFNETEKELYFKIEAIKEKPSGVNKMSELINPALAVFNIPIQQFNKQFSGL